MLLVTVEQRKKNNKNTSIFRLSTRNESFKSVKYYWRYEFQKKNLYFGSPGLVYGLQNSVFHLLMKLANAIRTQRIIAFEVSVRPMESIYYCQDLKHLLEGLEYL